MWRLTRANTPEAFAEAQYTLRVMQSISTDQHSPKKKKKKIIIIIKEKRATITETWHRKNLTAQLTDRFDKSGAS